jgi:ligand-binding sensor domain-containing protein
MKTSGKTYFYLFANFLFVFVLLFISTEIFPQNNKIKKYLDGIKITDIKSDAKDIWVATEGDGIFRYIFWKKKWINFSSANKRLKQDFFYCIETSSRFIWAGSTNGLYIYDKKRYKWKRKTFSKGGQFGNWIRALEYDKKKKTLWIGRFKFLSKYDLRKRKYYDYNLTVDNNDKTNSIKSLFLDGDSLLWIGTEAGLHKFNKKGNLKKKKGLFFFDNYNDFFNNEGVQVSISSMLGEQNNIWYGTNEFVTSENPEFNIGGLFKYDRKIDWMKFDLNNGLQGNGILDLELAGNYIWVAIYQFDPESKREVGQGIAIINRVTNEIIHIQNSDISNDVNSLHFDGTNMWVGTNDGIYRIPLKNNAVANFGK